MRAEQIRRTIRDQHAKLRGLIEMGLAHSHVAAGTGDAIGHEALRALVSTIRDVFVQHLADEEALILPLFADDLPLGPLRAKRLREEHGAQRAELDALCAWPDEAGDPELALSFAALGIALLEDIAEEERELLTPEIVRDDCIVVDQLGG